MSPEPLTTVSGRILPATVVRLDRVAAELGKRRPGEVVKRSDSLRIAIERGVEVLEAELGITGETPSAKPAKKGGKAPRKA